jgi:hypothetical protein
MNEKKRDLRQSTMTKEILPPRPTRLPLPRDSALLKVYNVLKNPPFRPKTYKEIESSLALHDVGDVRRAVRELKKRNWVCRIPKEGSNPKWEVIR